MITTVQLAASRQEMSVSSLTTPRDVHTTINYYKDPGDGTAHAPSLAGKRATFNQPSIDFGVIVKDITGNEEQYSLNSHGFQLFHHTSKEKAFQDEDLIKSNYYSEVEDLVYEV